ncbi:MAG: AAA family ATPase [Gemmataceae bacterium]|nr:AAA family ATPase [Gemmataceae bacterium]
MPMQLPELLAALSRPDAYPDPVAQVTVCQTHISAVFLTDRFAYKLKKPVRLDFLDFSTPEKRRHFCAEEVRLNRRLAPDVYLGVVPVARYAAGVRFEGEGEVIDWAVKMQRLPAEATLERRLEQGEDGAGAVEGLARRIAAFHAAAESGPHVSAFGRFEVVAGNARDNLAQAGAGVSSAVLGRLRTLTEAALGRLRPLIDARAARGATRDTHGDLRLDHIYLFPERPPPGDLVIIDCIEFNERFRFADPVADMAFLVMDLAFHDRRALGRRFADAYFRAAADEEGRLLLPFYTAYRAAVRGKVEGLKAGEAEVPTAEREAARASARARWLLALGELEEPGRRPCLVLVGGLPGSGKSTLSRRLQETAGFTMIRSDVVRKELAGLASDARPPAGTDIYTPAWSDRTYAECLRRAEAALAEGGRVLVDANFREERRREAFLRVAGRLGVPAVFLLCRADPERVRGRLQGRTGDASDADYATYLRLRASWEEPTPLTRRHLHLLPTDGSPEETLALAHAALRGEDLC